MVQHGHLAERMPLQMLGRLRVAGQHVQRHLLEIGKTLLRQHHLDGADVGGTVEAP
jgi:hypothetical protein